MAHPSLTALVRAASAGDQAAWDALVDRFVDLVWGIARSYRLDPGEAADATQSTWLRLVEHLDRIRDPERLGSWLAVTARTESIAALRRRTAQPASLRDGDGVAEAAEEPPAALLADERDRTLWQGFAALPERCRVLLQLVVLADDEPSYAEVAELLGVPIGSIGPTRGRCLTRLRRELARRGIRFAPATSLGGGKLQREPRR